MKYEYRCSKADKRNKNQITSGSYTTQPLIKRNNVKSILSSLRERKKGRKGRKERMNEGMKEGRSISCIKNGLAQFKLQPGLGKLDFTALLLIFSKFKTVAIC